MINIDTGWFFCYFTHCNADMPSFKWRRIKGHFWLVAFTGSLPFTNKLVTIGLDLR